MSNDYLYYCKEKESLAKRAGRSVKLLSEAEWTRVKTAFDQMEEEVYSLTKDLPYDTPHPAIGQGYPCLFWVQRLVEICPDHNEVLDPDEGCNTCYIYTMAEIEESAIEAGMPRPTIDLNYRALKKQIEAEKNRDG